MADEYVIRIVPESVSDSSKGGSSGGSSGLGGLGGKLGAILAIAGVALSIVRPMLPMIKWNIILGIKSAPFFSQAISEERGAQPVVNKRLQEFRKIPSQAVDVLFQKVKDYNAVKYDDQFAKK